MTHRSSNTVYTAAVSVLRETQRTQVMETHTHTHTNTRAHGEEGREMHTAARVDIGSSLGQSYTHRRKQNACTISKRVGDRGTGGSRESEVGSPLPLAIRSS